MFEFLAFLFSVPIAWAFGRYVQCANRGRALEATFWDLVVMGFSHIGVLSLWSYSGDSVSVLVSAVLGSGVGTYLVVKFDKKQ